jgi:hypothetical protein
MPAARTADPGTSKAAARTAHNPTEVQARVLDIVTDASAFGSGLTDEGIIAVYTRTARVNGWTMPSEQSIRSRRKELERSGRIRMALNDDDTPIYGTTRAGNKSHLWKAATA